MLRRIGHCGRTADEDGIATVEAADPAQSAQDIRQVTAEDAAIHMQFVNNDILQVRKELLPLGVMRQDSGVQHIRVGDDNMPLLADGLTRVIRGIAVIGERLDIGLQIADQPHDLVHLVLGQGLRREEIEGASLRLIENPLQDGEIVAEGLAAGGRGHQNHVPCPDGPVRPPLPDGYTGRQYRAPPAPDGSTDRPTREKERSDLRERASAAEPGHFP